MVSMRGRVGRTDANHDLYRMFQNVRMDEISCFNALIHTSYPDPIKFSKPICDDVYFTTTF